jgi:CBS domain-containing protein
MFFSRVGVFQCNEPATGSTFFTLHAMFSYMRHVIKIVFLVFEKSLDTPVGKAASSPLKTAAAGISIHKAAKIMAAEHVRWLPLVKKKQIYGIITARDLVEAYAR